MNAIYRPPPAAPMIPENAPFSQGMAQWIFRGPFGVRFAKRHRPPRAKERGACRHARNMKLEEAVESGILAPNIEDVSNIGIDVELNIIFNIYVPMVTV